MVETLIMELPKPNIPGESVEEENEVVYENEELIEHPSGEDESKILASEEEGDNLPPSGNASIQSSVTSQVEEDLMNEKGSINGESDMGNKNDNSECPSEDSLDEGASDDRENENIEEQDISSEDSNTEVVEEEISTVKRREGLRPKRPVTFNHKYDHSMAIVMTQMSVGKGIKKFGEKAVDAATKEFTQLDEKGVLLPRHLSELTQEEKETELSRDVHALMGENKDCLSLLKKQLHLQYLLKV